MQSSLDANSKKYTDSSPQRPAKLDDSNMVVYELVLYVRQRKYTNCPDNKINFEVISLPNNIYMQILISVMDILYKKKTIGCMSSSFRRARALFNFMKSKLMSPILKPNATDPVFMIHKESCDQQKHLRSQVSKQKNELKLSKLTSIFEIEKIKSSLKTTMSLSKPLLSKDRP